MEQRVDFDIELPDNDLHVDALCAELLGYLVHSAVATFGPVVSHNEATGRVTITLSTEADDAAMGVVLLDSYLRRALADYEPLRGAKVVRLEGAAAD